MYIDKDWYNLTEIKEFVDNFSEELLSEAASVKTRIKLARSAKRTARKRAFIRKLREKKRKRTPDLKKRAYSEVRSAFRKKLFKGSWKKLPYSARQRIDAAIQRRKPIISKMIDRIMPSVTRGESKRLQKLAQKKKR